VTTTAVVVMAYGTPADRDAIGEFYTDVRRGHPPTKAQLDELIARYDAIGGTSPMNARTAAQIAALQSALDALEPGRFRTYYGSKHADPKIEAAIERAAGDSCDAVVGLVLAPHFSAMSVGEYIARASKAASDVGLRASFLEHWHEEPALIEALATRVSDALGALSPNEASDATVVVTAHSLPARVLETNDPYPDEIAKTAELLAARLGLASWRTGWQSAGRTGEAWLGPDICEIIDELATNGATAVVVCPAGFTSDHLEVLYDLDIVAANRAAAAGIAFVRTASLNAEPTVFQALARRVIELDEQGTRRVDAE
jgi:protoporphyrin/coproporphyrin ferrochelatase